MHVEIYTDTAPLFSSFLFNKLMKVSSGYLDVNGYMAGKGAGKRDVGWWGTGMFGLHCLEDHVINRCLEVCDVLVLFN